MPKASPVTNAQKKFIIHRMKQALECLLAVLRAEESSRRSRFFEPARDSIAAIQRHELGKQYFIRAKRCTSMKRKAALKTEVCHRAYRETLHEISGREQVLAR